MHYEDNIVGKLFVPSDPWKKMSSRYSGSLFNKAIDSYMPVLLRAHEGNPALYGPNDDVWVDMVMRRFRFDSPALCVAKREMFFDGRDRRFYLEPRGQAYSKFIVYEFFLNGKYFCVKNSHMQMVKMVKNLVNCEAT